MVDGRARCLNCTAPPPNKKRPAVHAGPHEVNSNRSRNSPREGCSAETRARHCGSVTTQYPGVKKVAAEIGCVSVPLELTVRAPNCVVIVLPFETLL